MLLRSGFWPHYPEAAKNGAIQDFGSMTVGCYGGWLHARLPLKKGGG